MMRVFTSLLALALLLVLGWFAYQYQRTGELPLAAWFSGDEPAPDGAGSRASGSLAGAPGATSQAGGAQGGGAPAGRPVAGQGARPGAAPGGRPPGGPGGPGGGRPATVVTVAKVTTQNIEDQVTAVGSLLAAQSVLVKPEIPGRVDAVAITDGARVSAGDELFSLDRSVIEAELAQAQAELALARSNLKRTTNLASQAFVSERSRDEALANVRVLEARLQVVQARLDKTRIRAPFDAVAGLLQVSLGDYVQAGTEMVRLDDLSTLKLDLRVPERLFARLQRGQPIRVRFDAYPQREFTAQIETIDARLDDSGRSVIVRGRLDNGERLLRPGMFARARLVLGQREAAVMVPEASIVPDADAQYVYKVEGSTARRTRVVLGSQREGLVEVIEGLSAGDTVVLAGQINLRGAEAPVRIVDREVAAADEPARRP